MGRNAAKELERIVSTISGYLDAAAANATLSLTYEAIERATGVSRGHLSRRNEPEITALVQRVAQLKGGRRDGATASAGASSQEPTQPPRAPVHLPTSGTLAALPDATLATMIRRDLREVGRLQAHWTGRHGRVDVDDAPLALHDADELLRRLRSAVERVRPAVAEWTRRRAMLAEAVGRSDNVLSLEGP